MRASVKAFSFFLVGALAFIAVLTPTSVEAQEVELNAEICLDLQAAAIVDADGLAIELDVGAIVQVLLGLDLDLDQPLAIALAGQVTAGGCAAFLPVPDEPAAGVMTVFVLDADDNPIEGASVWFNSVEESGTVSPTDGSFTTLQEYQPGTYTFTVVAPGYENFPGSITIADGDVSTTVYPILIPVANPGAMTVIVLDADDNPIEGASVWFDTVEESGTVNPDDGSFTTAQQYQPNTYTFTVVAPGYENFPGSITIVDGDAGITVNLTALPAPGSGFMTVIVLDADDNIIPGATVSFTDIDEGGTVFPNDGSFTTDTIYAPGTYAFTASAVGYESVVDSVVIVEGNASTTVNLAVDADVETGTVTASVFHCLGLDTPEPLPVVGDDCIPGPGAFDFFLIGDGTDDSWRLTVGEDGVNSITLQVGEYEVYEVTTDTRVSNVVVTAGGNAEISFGIPRVVPPPTETGILSVSTYTCANLSEPVVLGEIGDDCVRISTDLSFYLWGDGTNEFWPLTTSNTAAVDIELPVGDYEVIDEPTQWSVSATVVEEGSTVAFGFPAYQAPVDPVDPVDPADPTDPDKVAPPVSGLPETGVGTGSSMGALSVLLGGAVMAAGALGVRIRKS